MLDPKDLPLRDIHLPAPIGWWPLAPGWWILAGVLAGILLVGLSVRWWLRRTRLRRSARRRLQEIVAAYVAHQDKGRLTRELSVLCRQVALQFFGTPEIATVTGAAWLARLDTTSDQHFFSAGPGRILAEAPYNPAANTFDSAALLAGCMHWLRRLPATPAVPQVEVNPHV
jgi:hypothetical protein